MSGVSSSTSPTSTTNDTGGDSAGVVGVVGVLGGGIGVQEACVLEVFSQAIRLMLTSLVGHIEGTGVPHTNSSGSDGLGSEPIGMGRRINRSFSRSNEINRSLSRSNEIRGGIGGKNLRSASNDSVFSSGGPGIVLGERGDVNNEDEAILSGFHILSQLLQDNISTAITLCSCTPHSLPASLIAFRTDLDRLGKQYLTFLKARHHELRTAHSSVTWAPQSIRVMNGGLGGVGESNRKADGYISSEDEKRGVRGESEG